MDITEALEVIGALVDRLGTGEESEAMEVINDWVDRERHLPMISRDAP